MHATAVAGGFFTLNGLISVSHSIIAGNYAGFGSPELFTLSSLIVADYSLIGDTAGLTPTQLANLNAGTGNILNQDPLLGPLVYNGGPVFADGSKMLTHVLLPGSPAIDAGDPAAIAGMNGVPEFDQRGMPWGRVVGGRIDMGAFELQANPLAGDYNFNGVVDAADYTVWRNTLRVTDDLRADGSGGVDQRPAGRWERVDGGCSRRRRRWARLRVLEGEFWEYVAPGAGGGEQGAEVGWVEFHETHRRDELVGLAELDPPYQPQGVPLVRETRGTVSPRLSFTSLGETRPRGVHPRRDVGSAGASPSRQLAAREAREDALVAWLASRGERANQTTGDGSAMEEVDTESESSESAVEVAFAGLGTSD